MVAIATASPPVWSGLAPTLSWWIKFFLDLGPPLRTASLKMARVKWGGRALIFDTICNIVYCFAVTLI